MKMERVEIKNKTQYIKRNPRFFKKYGFKYEATGPHSGKWEHTVPEKWLPKIKRYCKKHGYEYMHYDEKYARSSNYRSEFFKHNKPKLFRRYQCAYCSKLLKKKDVTVDHLIPIGKVKYKISWRIIMHLCGIFNINSYRNLVCACEKCNSKKSDKTGFWLIRGALGKHLWFWIIFYGAVITLIVSGIYYRSDIVIFAKKVQDVYLQQGADWIRMKFIEN